MTDQQREALKLILRETARRSTVDRETARRSLIDEGIYNEDGELMPEFGGSEETSANQLQLL
ncbi:hypothetical protein QE372_004876 [Agrobacterium pusense]|uniref:hypothetical protein n=1 Tax=Agrobacterium pusense TaxID=648995 RepID=UPI00114DF825|nr:hypothetical protein [Agrobacterium pusense]MDR6192542.1 hypothetical protein [Agrobacterium pusense]